MSLRSVATNIPKAVKFVQPIGNGLSVPTNRIVLDSNW